MQDPAIDNSQLWNGAPPNLILIPTIKQTRQNEDWKSNRLPRRAKINRTEANVWVKKYLIADSEDVLLLVAIKKGTKTKVFSSNPSQQINKEEEEITKNTLKKILTENNPKAGESHIGKKVEPIDGAWARKLHLAYLSLHVDV